MIHTKQLLLVTFCQPTAGIGVSFRTDAQRTDGGGRTDRRGSRNSYLDTVKYCKISFNIVLNNVYYY